MYLLGMRYLEALPKLAEGKGSTIFLPSEATGVMGALGGLRELLKKGEGEKASGAQAPSGAYPPPRPPTARATLLDSGDSTER